MRSECDRLEEQLRLAFEGEAWHGPSVMEALQDVSAEIASQHPIAGAHSIWELVLHLAGTYRLVLRRLTGDASALAASEDWPSVPLQPTEADWVAATGTLRELNAQMRRAVADFPHDRLDEPLVEQPAYSAYTQFIGLTQHDLYHAGQIVLLKRAVRAERRRAALDRPALLADADGEAAWESAAESIRSAGSYRWVRLYEVGACASALQPLWLRREAVKPRAV